MKSMKKISLAVACLLVAQTLHATPTAVQSPDAPGSIQLNLSGNMLYFGYYVDQQYQAAAPNNQPKTSDRLMLATPSTVVLKGKYTISDQNTASIYASYDYGKNAIREAYIEYDDKKLGTFRVGDMNGAVHNLSHGAEQVLDPLGSFDGSLTDLPINYPPGFTTDSSKGGDTLVSTGSLGSFTDKNTHVAYYSPSFYGLSIGVSYLPSEGKTITALKQPTATHPTVENVLEAAASYTKPLNSDLSITLGGGYRIGSTNNDTVTAPLNDLHAFQAGTVVTYKSFKVAAGYTNGGTSLCETNSQFCKASRSYDIGAGYSLGSLDLGLAYFHAYATPNTAASSDIENKYDVIAISSTYKIISGVSVFAEYNKMKFEYYNNPATDKDTLKSDANVFMLGTLVTF